MAAAALSLEVEELYIAEKTIMKCCFPVLVVVVLLPKAQVKVGRKSLVSSGVLKEGSKDRRCHMIDR